MLDNFPEIEKLPIQKRIQLVEEIWDTIRSSEEETPIPDFHKELIDERLKTLDSKKLITLDELKRRMSKRK